jgi:hypothetical protein
MENTKETKIEVFDFTREHLKEAIIDENHSIDSANKSHLKYLYEYLDDIKCNTIVVEDPYIDGDYLDDYSTYYVKCFKRYKRKCKRIHFFAHGFTEDDLLTYIRQGNNGILNKDIIQEHYLGFTVIRPLPSALIGRTILSPYPSDQGRRNFPCTKEYKLNFLGSEIGINSLAFQEQDKVLAACATTALWSALHMTADLFGSKLLTPCQITAVASRHFLFANRALPSHGLNMFQMCQTIKDVGLEPEFRDYNNIADFSGFILGYLQYGIPVILGIELIEPHELNPIGLHAVTITGFSTKDELVSNGPFPLKAHRVDKYYVHDDQVGPFSRLNLDDPIKPDKVVTGWKCECGCGKNFLARPKIIIVPVYHKIRITYEDVTQIVGYFHEFFELIFNGNIVWDIQLAKVNQFKEHFHGRNDINPNLREKVSLHNYPRYFWRAILYINSMEFIELIFDSTDIQSGMFLNDIIFYHDAIKERVRIAVDNDIHNLLPQEYRNFLKETTKIGS